MSTLEELIKNLRKKNGFEKDIDPSTYLDSKSLFEQYEKRKYNDNMNTFAIALLAGVFLLAAVKGLVYYTNRENPKTFERYTPICQARDYSYSNKN